MATEKLGKALLVAGEVNLEEITHSHSAFVKFVRIVGNSKGVSLKLGLSHSQFRAEFRKLVPIASEIERLAPALAMDGPNPEYPWLDKQGNIRVPTEWSFPLSEVLKAHAGIRLLKYIEYLLTEFERLFPN